MCRESNPGLFTMERMPVVQARALAPSVDIDLPPIAASSIIPVSEDELTNRDLNQLARAGVSSGTFSTTISTKTEFELDAHKPHVWRLTRSHSDNGKSQEHNR